MVARKRGEMLLTLKLEELGMKNISLTGTILKLIREEIRLIIKGLDNRYVLWIDADTIPPRDAIARLLAVGSDMAAGWFIDRHYPFQKTSFETVSQCALETEQEKMYVRDADDFIFRFYSLINELSTPPSWLFSTNPFASPAELTREDWDMKIKEGYVMPPSTVRKQTAPIECTLTGFGCVLVKRLMTTAFFYQSMKNAPRLKLPFRSTRKD